MLQGLHVYTTPYTTPHKNNPPIVSQWVLVFWVSGLVFCFGFCILYYFL
ncbi:hypothetical protein PL9214291363 [Planktothrix tepida PCC 9214]|uniref:Uncharacterized protein n=1 Tax=Planktothrix tepida PCC 9214 TaxID=671072 RepID=A0A1J1LID4_9CYAN|nr:hypothetical protein PL9214291363 [Planktothrix tepida PCC 9214]